MKYYLMDIFGTKAINKGDSMENILTQYRYFSDKDRIVSTDYKEKYKIAVDRPNKTITLNSVNSSKAIVFKKDRDGKYVEVE